jgi:hypothetical protein
MLCLYYILSVDVCTWLVWLWLDIVYKAEYESAVLDVYLTAAVLRAEFLVPSLSLDNTRA